MPNPSSRGSRWRLAAMAVTLLILGLTGCFTEEDENAPPPPRVFAGNDTALLNGDTLHLRGTIVSGTEAIVKWEWEFTNRYETRIVEVTGGDTALVLQTDEANSVCRLRVTDRYGRTSDDAFVLTRLLAGQVWREHPTHIPHIPGRDVKRSCATLKNKAWIFLSSEDASGVRPIQAWNSADGTVWTLAADSLPMPPRILRSIAVRNDSLWVFGGEKAMGGRAGFNDVWVTGDGLRWEKIADTSPIDTGNNGDIAFTKTDSWNPGAADLRLIVYDGSMWITKNGREWKSGGPIAYRPDEMGSVANWDGSGKYGPISESYYCGTRGILRSQDGLFLEGGATDQPLTGFATSEILVAIDGSVAFSYELDNRGLLARIPFPGQWPNRIKGLYPHCLFSFEGKILAIKGGRLKDEPEAPNEAYFTR
jgi:hypothetical protein